MSIPISLHDPRVAEMDSKALSKLKRHTMAVRQNPDLVQAILEFLLEDPPNASAAREVLQTCERQVAIDLWSCSPTNGGIWETWMRDALKYGDVTTTNSYAVFRARKGLPPLRT